MVWQVNAGRVRRSRNPPDRGQNLRHAAAVRIEYNSALRGLGTYVPSATQGHCFLGFASLRRLQGEKMRIVKIFTTTVLIFLIAFLSQMRSANAGWFGYESYQECFVAERQKRMNRWISPMNAMDASVAAMDACQKIAKPYSSPSSPEQLNETSEQRQREELAREEKMRNFRGPCTFQAYQAGYCTLQQKMDYDAQKSIEAERKNEEDRRRSEEDRRRTEEDRLKFERDAKEWRLEFERMAEESQRRIDEKYPQYKNRTQERR